MCSRQACRRPLSVLDSLLAGRLSMGLGAGKERAGFAAHLEVALEGLAGQVFGFSQSVLGVIKQNDSAFATIQ